MKKLVLLAALLVVAAASFAFLPKADEPKGYMLVISDTFNNTLVTISPDGVVQENRVEVTRRANLSKKLQVRQAELALLNTLRQQGWVVSQQHSSALSAPWSAFAETTTLLEHR